VQKNRNIFYEHLLAGNPPPAKMRKYRLCDERINRIVANYGRYDSLEFLRGVAHNFAMD